MSTLFKIWPIHRFKIACCPHVFRAQGKLDDAEPLLNQAQAINAKLYCAGHPKIASDHFNRAGLLLSQARLISDVSSSNL